MISFLLLCLRVCFTEHPEALTDTVGFNHYIFVAEIVEETGTK